METAVPTPEPQMFDEQPLYENCFQCLTETNHAVEVNNTTTDYENVLKTKRHCRRCLKPFCTKHVSPISPIHCNECRPLVVHEEEVVRVDKHENYDELEDKVIITQTKSHCTRITFEGLDGSFYAEAIASKSIEELKGFVKAHQAIIRLMEDEILSKQIKKNTAMFRMAGAIAPLASATNGKPKNGTKSKTKKVPSPEEIAQLIKGLGLNQQQLDALKNALGGGN